MVKMARKEEGKSGRYAVTTNNLQAETGKVRLIREAHARVKDGRIDGDEGKGEGI